MTRARPWIELGFFLLVLALLWTTSRARFFYDPGSFWHIRVGQELFARGFFTTDPFTYTQAGRTWVPTQWLAEAVMATAHDRMGLDGLLWAALLIVAGLFAWLSGRYTAAGCHPLLTALFLGLVFMASCYHFHARPHLATLLFLALLVGWLADVEARRVPLWTLIGFVPFFILWVNLHGGVLGGMVTFGLVGIWWGVSFLAGKVSPLGSWRDVGFLALVGLACAATVVVNPYGRQLLTMWLEILQQDLPNIISEHRPLSLDRVEGWAVLGLGLLYLAVLAGTWGTWPRATWLVPLVWLVQGWLRTRNGPLFAVAAGVAMAEMLPYCRWMRALAARSDLYVLPATEPPPSRPILNHALWLLLLPVPFLLPGTFRGHLQLDAEHWPISLIPQLRTELQKPGAVICNDDVFGGFLLYYVPHARIFIDDRCELHGRDLLLDFVAALRGPPALTAEAFTRWQQRYRINLVLTRAKTAIATELGSRPDWKIIGKTVAPPDKQVLLFKFEPRLNLPAAVERGLPPE